MKLSDRDLEVFSKHIGQIPFINMTKENVEILKSIVDELIKLRKQCKNIGWENEGKSYYGRDGDW